MSSYTFIDLFAGIGGIRMGFEQAGCRCVFSSEKDKFCRETYRANYGACPAGDITLIDAKDIPDHDILLAGFPCQPFSVAGLAKRKALGMKTGFEDETKGTMFFEICRILKEKRPRAFMLENVKNLIHHDRGRTFRTILESLDRLNYEVFYTVLDGADYVPQHRKRVTLVGFDRSRYGNDVEFVFSTTPVEPRPVLRDILESGVDEKYTLSDKLWTYLVRRKEEQRLKGNNFGYRMPVLDGPGGTLPARYARDGADLLIAQDGKNPRRLTPRECARYMGFPDTFRIVVSDRQAYKQFGNSVVVPMIADVADLLVRKLDELEPTERGDGGFGSTGR